MFQKVAVLVGCPCSTDGPSTISLGQDDLVEASCDLDHVVLQPEHVKTEEAKEDKGGSKEAPVTPAMPNFSGEWTLLKVEGNFDEYLKSMGVGYMSRSMAKTMGYGVKKVHQTVEHEEDKLKITQTNPKGTKVFNLLTNGEEQDGMDPIEDKPVKIRSTWDGQTLVMTLRSEKPPKEFGQIKRYLREEDTIQELVSPNGLAVKRVFSRKVS